VVPQQACLIVAPDNLFDMELNGGFLLPVFMKSHKRKTALQKHTWKHLVTQYCLQADQVHIFVSTKEDYKDYSETFYPATVVQGPFDVAPIDNFMVDYADKNNMHEYLYCNDDFLGIYTTVLETTSLVKLLKSEFYELVQNMLEEMRSKNISYGGFYPSSRQVDHIAKGLTRHHLCSIMDNLSVIRNCKEVCITCGFKSDAEKSIKHFATVANSYAGTAMLPNASLMKRTVEA
jgi:hypothetical protein